MTITINEAIKEGKTILAVSSNVLTVKQQKAVQLGIEALKRCLENREYRTVGSAILLPGETED